MASSKEGEPTSKLEPKSKIRPDAIRTSGKVQFVDAARPVDPLLKRSTRHSQESAFTQYYDDPWYYEERDASYTMTSRPAPDDPHLRSTERSGGSRETSRT